MSRHQRPPSQTWRAFLEYHLRDLVSIDFFTYYQDSRTHLSLDKDAPNPRDVQPPAMGEVIELPEVGGLHHRYARRAA